MDTVIPKQVRTIPNIIKLSVLTALVLISVCPQSKGQTTQCSSTDILSLVRAGYSKANIDSMCQSSSAFFNRSAVVEFQSFVFSRFLNAMAPVKFSVNQNNTPAELWLEDMKYCGNSDEHGANVLGFGETGNPTRVVPGTQSVAPSLVFEDADCSLDLDQLKQRVKDRVGSTVQWFVGRVALEWVPWSLKLKLLSAVSNGPLVLDNLTVPPMNFPTDGLSLNIGNQKVMFNLSFYFTKSSMVVVMAPTTDVSSISSLTQIPNLASVTWTDGQLFTTDKVNARISIKHAVLNYLGTSYFNGSASLPIETGIPALGTIQMKDLKDQSLIDDQLVLTGLAVDSGNQQYRCEVEFDGKDLNLQSIKIEPVGLESCPSGSVTQDSIQCLARNIARSAGSSLIAQGLRSSYNGRALRTFGSPDVIPVKFGSGTTLLTPYIDSITSTSTALEAKIWISLKRQ